MSGKDRKLAAFSSDDDDRRDHPDRRGRRDQLERDDVDEDRDDREASDDAEECDVCGSPSVAYSDASEVHDALPEKPLCRKCILDRL